MRIARYLLLFIFAGTAMTWAGEASPVDLMKNGKVDEAIRVLVNEINSNPNNARAYADLCRVYNSIGDLDNAIQNCQKATQLQPNVAEYHLWLGRAYGDKADRSGPFGAIGWAKKTVAEFERAVQLAPNDIQARADLTEFYREAPGMVGGGMDKARRVASDTAKIDPAAGALANAQFALKDKDYSAAESEAKRAVQLSGGAAQYLLELARVYGKQKRWTDFESTITRALESKKKRSLDTFEAADMLVSNGRNLNGAIQLLRSYLGGAMDEEGPAFRAHYLIGRAYEKQGNKAEAAQEYRSALQLASGYRTAQEALRRVSG